MKKKLIYVHKDFNNGKSQSAELCSIKKLDIALNAIDGYNGQGIISKPPEKKDKQN